MSSLIKSRNSTWILIIIFMSILVLVDYTVTSTFNATLLYYWPSTDVFKKITIFLLSFLEIYLKICSHYLNWSLGNGCWRFSIKAKCRKFWKTSKIHVWVTREVFRKNDSREKLWKLKGHPRKVEAGSDLTDLRKSVYAPKKAEVRI